jgi:1-deoxy-D-xylulose-5-phosphate reductoisomerase
MRVPIAHALSDANRLPIDFDPLDFTSLNLSFQAFPSDKIEIENIAREVCNKGSNLGAVFNAANEVAVESFLNNEINFDKIYEVIYRTFDANDVSNDLSIDSINDIDTHTRIEAKKVVKSLIN